MATETLHPAAPFTPAASGSTRTTPLHDNLGAFRGLAFALAFEAVFAALALAVWKLLHLLR